MTPTPTRRRDPHKPTPRGTTGMPLTDRELQVVKLVAEGMTDKLAARRLGMTPGAVGNAVQRVQRRTGALTRSHIVAIAFRAGVIT